MQIGSSRAAAAAVACHRTSASAGNKCARDMKIDISHARTILIRYWRRTHERTPHRSVCTLVRYAKRSYLRTRARPSKYVRNLSNFYKSLGTHTHSSDPGIALAHTYGRICVSARPTHTHTQTDKIVINCVSGNKSNQPHVCRASANANICTAIGGTQSYTLAGVLHPPRSPRSPRCPPARLAGRTGVCDTQPTLLPGRRRRRRRYPINQQAAVAHMHIRT